MLFPFIAIDVMLANFSTEDNSWNIKKNINKNFFFDMSLLIAISIYLSLTISIWLSHLNSIWIFEFVITIILVVELYVIGNILTMNGVSRAENSETISTEIKQSLKIRANLQKSDMSLTITTQLFHPASLLFSARSSPFFAFYIDLNVTFSVRKFVSVPNCYSNTEATWRKFKEYHNHHHHHHRYHLPLINLCYK